MNGVAGPGFAQGHCQSNEISRADEDGNESVKLLSVIIVSYENWGVLKSCLDSIKEHNDLNGALEVIVVEQSASDSIYESLLEEYPWVIAVRNANDGFGAGNNRGHEASHGRYLLFLNPDTILVEPVFAFAIERFEEDGGLGLLGVRLVGVDGRRCQSFYFRQFVGLVRGRVWRALDRLEIFLPRSMYITGADMFVRREAFEAAGRFDERIFMYCEEPDLCYRLNDLGYSIGYFPQRRIVHLEGRSSSGDEFRVRVTLDSLRVLCEKRGADYGILLGKWRRSLLVKKALLMGDPAYDGQIRLLEDRIFSCAADGKREGSWRSR